MSSVDIWTQSGVRDAKAARNISVWLYIMCGLVALMVTVGGATRLTDSGLSITQWDLIIGTLPPMTEQNWLSEFEKYKQIPEYERVNKGMSLAEFKAIYWWEWGHRNLGRFIGLAYLFPLIWFGLSGAIKSRALGYRLGGIFLMICAQGALGWYMVSSGLVERVDVSQYRLAAHLGLAVIIFAALFWLALAVKPPIPLQLSSEANRKSYRLATIGLGALVFIQIILGAFVAGLRAGKAYTTWPLMDGRFFPEGYFQGNADFLHAFETMAAVQFNHRLGAYLLIFAAVSYWFYVRKGGPEISRRALVIAGVVVAQAGLGIWTLVSAVPINLGLAHQLGALLVLMVVMYTLFTLTIPERRGR